MARVICPFCLKPHDFDASLDCPTTEYRVPVDYVSEYRSAPPLWLVTVGFSGHGKTTYLAALTLMLENMDRVWERMFSSQMDNHTMQRVREIRLEAMQGDLQAPTDVDTPRPLLFNVQNLPGGSSRSLVMYDVAGQIFEDLDEVHKYVAALKQVTTTWFLISPRDLRAADNDKTIPELFTAYRSGMRNLRIDLNQRNLIVIYTKADIADFPRDIQDYLINDPLRSLTQQDGSYEQIDFALDEYVWEMRQMSERLKIYTKEKVQGGRAFISMVESSGMNLVFCTTSALGDSPDPTQGIMLENAPRYRVLDPFLWATTLDKPVKPRSIGLILDAAEESYAVYDDDLVRRVTESLAIHGDLTTYHLGSSVPIGLPGQPPPDQPPYSAYPRLLGPILEQAAPDTQFLLLTNGRILDLEDFRRTAWQDRVLVVAMPGAEPRGWPHQIVYRNGTETKILVDRLLNN